MQEIRVNYLIRAHSHFKYRLNQITWSALETGESGRWRNGVICGRQLSYTFLCMSQKTDLIIQKHSLILWQILLLYCSQQTSKSNMWGGLDEELHLNMINW